MTRYNVVIQTAFIGDLFLSIPLLNRIKKNFPNHGLILVCKKGLGEFFLKQNLVEKVFEIEKGQASVYNTIVSQLNQYDIENLFCLHRSVRSSLFSWKIKAQKKIGFGSGYKKMFFDELVPYPQKWPEVIRQMTILTPLDAELRKFIQQKDWAEFNFKQPNQKFLPIPELFRFPSRSTSIEKQVALFPGSVWATKKWTPQGYAHVARELQARGYRVCLMGGPGDQSEAQKIKNLVPQTEDLTGRMSLYESVLYLHNFALIICNDSAPSHMAACLERPVLSVFGPTVLDFGFRPWNDLSQVVEMDHLVCRPCGPHGHDQCPLGHHDCMKKIDPQHVSQTALRMLGEI